MNARADQTPEPARRPHLLLFVADQWRGDVMGHLGHPAAQTPRLDAFAEQGVSFSRAFCQNPVCGPSRCSMMTGWYPHVKGHRTQSHLLRPRHGEPSLPAVLRDSGYHVWWAGKNDTIAGQEGAASVCDHYNRPHPTEPIWAIDKEREWRGDPEGEDYYSFFVGELDKQGEHRHDKDWADVEDAIRVLETYDGDKPLCMIITLTYPHAPFGVEEPWFSAIDRDAVPPRIEPPDGYAGKPAYMKTTVANSRLEGWSEAKWTELRAVYYAMCARVDEQFGRVCDALRRSGMYDDTAVVFTSDHGEYAGDYGMVEKAQNCFEDCLVRVPLLVKPPRGRSCAPRVTDAMVELIDLPATLYDYAGVEPGYWHFGRSLSPIVEGRRDAHRDAVFCEGGRLPGEAHCLNLPPGRTEPNRDALYWPRKDPWCRDGAESTKAVMCRTATHKYVRRLEESDELYDLVADPDERCNVIDEPAYAEVRSELRDRLLTFMIETADVVPFDQDARQFQQ